MALKTCLQEHLPEHLVTGFCSKSIVPGNINICISQPY